MGRGRQRRHRPFSRGSTLGKESALCAALDIQCDSSDPESRFVDSCFKRTDAVIHGLNVDVIATWRVALRMIVSRAGLGTEVQAGAGAQLQRWLKLADTSPTRIHIVSLTP